MVDFRLVRDVGLRLLVGTLLVGAMAWASDLPVGQDPQSAGLRLSWRARASVERCRDRSAKELARLAAHLRQPRECLQVPVDYHLTVQVDDQLVADELVRHHGVRSSRPLFVDTLLQVTPGRHRLRICWSPEPHLDDAASSLDGMGLEASHFDHLVDFEPAVVSLVSLDDGDLVLRPRA